MQGHLCRGGQGSHPWPWAGLTPADWCCLGRITSTVACDMDLAKYPMDEQECMLHLESCECGWPAGRRDSFLGLGVEDRGVAAF